MSGQVNIKPPELQICVLPALVGKLRRPVAADSRQRAVLHILDWLGSASLASKLPMAHGFRQVMLTAAAGPCRTIPGERRDWWHALQLNAALGNMLEMDDLHRTSILHPAPVIIPAAIVVAELTGASGEKLLASIVRGYEATIRIGRALGASHYAFFHNTSSAGTFGAAAAAADLLGLNAEQTVWALANAGSRTGGLWQMRSEDCETKSLHNAVAAQTGVQAALLAQQNVRGPASLLEGKQGLFAAMAPDAKAENVLANLDDDWLIHEVSFKPWPACRHAHPTIDAALAIRAKLLSFSGSSGIPPIASIEISSYQSAIDFCDMADPASESQAKFSLQHAAAIALIDGPPWLAQFSSATFNRIDVKDLRAKVSLRVSAEMTAGFPQHYAANMCVTLCDGRRFEHFQADALGDPECPMGSTRIIDKARRLLQKANVLGVEKLISATQSLNNSDSIEAFTAAWFMFLNYETSD